MSPAGIIDILKSHTPTASPSAGLIPAAVLIIIRCGDWDDDEPEIVFTRRSQNLPSHAGQISFPGGRIQSSDGTAERAALRESVEELGVESSEFTLIARLDDYVTITGYHVVPIVATMGDQVEFDPCEREVERVFSVPLGALLDESRWHQQVHRFREREVTLLHFAHDGEDIWGATAVMLRDFLKLIR